MKFSVHVCLHIRNIVAHPVGGIVPPDGCGITELECWDVAILTWCGHTLSAGMWSISCRTKLLETASQAAGGGEMCIAPYSNSSDGHPIIHHANGTLPHDL